MRMHGKLIPLYDCSRKWSNSQALKNMLAPSLPSLKESPEGRLLGSPGQAEGSPGQQHSGQLSSLPIVLSRQNSSSSEEDAASEPEIAGQLSDPSEDVDSADGSAQTTVEAAEFAHGSSGRSLEARQSACSALRMV